MTSEKQTKRISKHRALLTPAYNGVPVEIAPLGKEGLHQQSEEIQAFDEEPEIVGHDAVMEENHHRFTRHLHEENHREEKETFSDLSDFSQIIYLINLKQDDFVFPRVLCHS